MGNCCKKKGDLETRMIEEIIDNNNFYPLDIKVELEDFEKIKLLGKGSFGIVLLVKLKKNEKYYAMKILGKSKVKKGGQEIHAKVERDLIVKINCPFIVNIKFALQDKENLYLITEYMQGSDMYYHIHKEKQFSEEKAKFYAIEMILAIEFLQENNMLYRDLKPENIMIYKNGHIKLTDFGLIKILEKEKEKAFTICGTPKFLAPEILTDDGYDKTVDWWSFGCVIYEMIIGSSPFLIPKGKLVSQSMYKQKINIPSSISKEATDLITKLLVVKPQKRLGYGRKGAKNIKAHPFFKGINWKDA